MCGRDGALSQSTDTLFPLSYLYGKLKWLFSTEKCYFLCVLVWVCVLVSVAVHEFIVSIVCVCENSH